METELKTLRTNLQVRACEKGIQPNLLRFNKIDKEKYFIINLS